MMTTFEMRNESIDLIAEFPGVDVQITDYYYTGDGYSYDQHFYVIQVTIGKEKYVVDRSYVDFVVLQRNIRKSFVGSNIPDLPLRGAAMIEQMIAREAASLAETKKIAAKDPAMISSRLSIVDTSKRKSFMQKPGTTLSIPPDTFLVPTDSVEVISAMGQGLTLYLLELTCHHELLVSDELQTFLDEEISSMLVPVIPPTLTAFDLVLLNQSLRSGTVLRIEEHTFKVPAKHLIVWRFNTQSFDIAFTVEMNGKVKIPLTRYRSHEQAVCGALQVETFSDVLLRWDNTHAKLHAKALTWSVRILSLQEFENLTTQAMDCLREKKRFEQQRFCLRRSIISHAQKLSGIIHGSSLEADYGEEDYRRQKSLVKESNALKEQNRILLEDLEKAESKIDDLESHRQALVDSKHLLSESWKFSNSQLNELEEQVKDLQIMIGDMTVELQEKDAQLEQIYGELEDTRNKIDHSSQTLQSIVKSLEPKLKIDAKTYDDFKMRLDSRSKRIDQLVSEGKVTGEGKEACEKLLKDYSQVLSVYQVNQQLVSQLKDIMMQLIAEKEIQEEEEQVKAVADLSDF